MKLLGDYWTLRIIDGLKFGETRFCELQRSIDNVNPVTLTSRLKKLEEARLIIRSEETVDKISVTYCLTELGKEALPVIKALDRFALKKQSL
jgi:DNA-binding HxlR family transcriptional regulator